FKFFLHFVRSGEMVFASEQTLAIYHPVGRYPGFYFSRPVHGVSHQSGRAFGAQISCYGSITGYPPPGNEPGHLIHHLKKVFYCHHGSNFNYLCCLWIISRVLDYLPVTQEDYTWEERGQRCSITCLQKNIRENLF